MNADVYKYIGTSTESIAGLDVKWVYYLKTNKYDVEYKYEIYKLTLWENLYTLPNNPFFDRIEAERPAGQGPRWLGSLLSADDPYIRDKQYLVGYVAHMTRGKTGKNSLDQEEVAAGIRRKHERRLFFKKQLAKVVNAIEEAAKKAELGDKAALKKIKTLQSHRKEVLKEIENVDIRLRELKVKQEKLSNPSPDEQLFQLLTELSSPSRSPRAKVAVDELFPHQTGPSAEGNKYMLNYAGHTLQIMTLANHIMLTNLRDYYNGIEARHFFYGSPKKSAAFSPRKTKRTPSPVSPTAVDVLGRKREVTESGDVVISLSEALSIEEMLRKANANNNGNSSARF